MKKYLIDIVLLGFLGMNIFVFVPSIARSKVKLERIDKRSLEINSKKSVLEEKIADYDIKITKLNSPFYREKIGREKLQMIQEGEKIYKVTN
ncbi:MAG: septum formation initiator family protein [Fusobacteriaceae bacterium]